jgi:hypothetical protein
MSFPANIFVLCTGRCGSTTFAKACRYMTNYTAAHESRAHVIGPDRLAYPAGHIEVDNRLSWFLGRLEAAYGDNAAYVHLIRDAEETAKSYARRANQGILLAYRNAIIMRAKFLNPDATIMDYSRDYVATANANIAAYLRDKTHVRRIGLGRLRDDFDEFWDWIGAEGDRDAARNELMTRHNATERKTWKQP